MSKPELPVIAIVGRPNVGKSALFNRIMGRRISIVHEESGVTRDRIAAPAAFAGRHFLLIDTGGLGVLVNEKKVGVFEGLIRSQVASVVEEAAVILFVVDCQAGASPLDSEIAEFLRHSTAKVLVAANKADNESLRDVANAEFAPLGFPHVLPTSCTHSLGIAELLNECVADLAPAASPLADNPGIRLAVVGRPNVGKSSLVNRMLGEERVLVSEIPGTTRDAVDIPFRIKSDMEEVPATLIDTAGLRRRRRIDTPVEFFSVARAERTIKHSDVVLFVIDATAPGTAQDRRIANLITTARKPCIIVVNKWDLLSGSMKLRELRDLCGERIPFMRRMPIEIVCAVSGYNLSKILERLVTLHEQMQVIIPTPILNRFLQDVTARTPPPAAGRAQLKILYAAMTGNPPPHILLFTNRSTGWPAHYLQHLENRLCDAFFPGVGLPVWLELRGRRTRREQQDGTRRAVAGVKRDELRKHASKDRHDTRRKGWRKK